MEENNVYELAVVISPDLSEFDVQKIVDKVKISIASKGGSAQQEHTWGKKRLAYPIGKAEFGYYQTLIFDSPKEAIAEIDKDIRLTPEIIRHLIISLEKEGITAEQLFTPEKEAVLIATIAKEKMEPSRPHQTRASRGRITPAIVADIPGTKDSGVAPEESSPAYRQAGQNDDIKEVVDIAEPVVEETADEAAKRREELDKKLDELLKEE
ncbi:MAG: 30S ribosomal protein S6 [Patescibacteria group bacterium]